jgi:hypothetical protein
VLQGFQQRNREGVQPVDPAAFTRLIEDSYADEMDWRNAKGGPTEAEVRAVAASSGQSLTPELLESTLRNHRCRAMEGLREGLVDRWLRTVPEAERQELESGALPAVHDRLTPEELERIARPLLSPEETLPPELRSLSPREAYQRLNAGAPEEKRSRKLGTVSVPLEADIYQLLD